MWTGDDAALIRTGARTLITTDSITEHVDFELDWARGSDIGHKLVAINVSDIAAMGGRPTRAVATIQLGDETEVALVDDIAQGMADAAAAWGLRIVGGDIGRASELSLTLTLLGDVDEPVLRSGAKPDDLICVTGALGGAHAGLILLQTGSVDLDVVYAEIGTGSGADGRAVLAARQLRPQPRPAEGADLGPHVTAMIDVSDGLAIDLERLCDASGVGCEIDPSTIPLHPELDHGLDGLDRVPEPLECALVGGEDFELVFTVAERAIDAVHAVLDDIGTGVSVIGRITEGGRTIGERPLEDWSVSGWDHLRTR